MPDETTKPKPKHDLSKVKCFNSGQRGHIAPNYPEIDQTEQETETKGKQFVTWEDCQFEETDCESGMYMTYEVYESVHMSPKFRKYDILLDNQADVSIVHPHLLQDVLPAESPITVKGIGGRQLKAEHAGYLQDFFRVYASEQANPSVLSL
jgi:hypothetical protein